MTVALKDVNLAVGADAHIRDVSLTLERGTLNVLLGPTLAGKTSLMRLMAGLDRRPRAGPGRRQGRDRACRCARRVAMVYQQFINYPSLTVYENIASPLRVSGTAAARRSSGAVQRGRRAARARALSRSHAARALRRPAAAHRDRPRAGQGRRSRAARRAAGQSRLQAARGAARGAAEHLRRVRRDLRLCHDRARRGAAARRQHRDACSRAASRSSARRSRSTASRTTHDGAASSPIRR